MYPNDLLGVIDPIPDVDVDDLPVYSFPDFEGHVFIASNTNAVHVMRVENFFYGLQVKVVPKCLWERRRKYTEICLEGQKVQTGGSTVIPRGTMVILWNARSMARPSFKHLFLELFATHHPSLIVVTEARICNNDCKELLTLLPGKFDSTIFENHCRGVVLMWRVNDLYVDFKESDFDCDDDALFDVLFEVNIIPFFNQSIVFYKVLILTVSHNR